MKVYKDIFGKIVSAENLFSAWGVFKHGKRNKEDVQLFERHLEENIFALRRELVSKTYAHGPYVGFRICDPKPRNIHKALVRDRVLHHAVFSVINPIFEQTFIHTSFSCRIGFGTHKGVDALDCMIRSVGRNGHRQCYVLKCDIRKFFDSVDQVILMQILRKRIKDDDAMQLLEKIIASFVSPSHAPTERKGLPIGNLTSQLFANIYMNEFDQFVKHTLKVRHYVRYTDDFVVVSDDEAYLHELIPPIATFLKDSLSLELHPQKTTIRKVHQGVDFLGYVILPKHRSVRTKTRRRMFKKLKERVRQRKRDEISDITLMQSFRSYLGVLSHANTYHLTEFLKNQFWFWLKD